MRTRLFLFLLLLCIAGAPDVSAQASSDSTAPDNGMIYATVGGASTEIGGLNRNLLAFGFPTFTAEVPSLGIGGYGLVGDHWMLGGEGNAYFWGQGQRGRQDITIRGGYVLATVGYAFYPFSSRLPTFRVYPRLGLGAGTLRLRIAGTADTFANALQTPEQGVTLTRHSFLTSAAAGAEIQLLRETTVRFRLGVEVGYLGAPASTDWKISDTPIFGGPDASLQGPFIRLLIGRGI